MTEENKELKNSEDKVTFRQFCSENKWNIIAYFFLFLGLFMAFFDTFFGGLLIGTIAGLYFADSIKSCVQSIRDLIEKEGIFQAFVAIAATVGLFIIAPSFMIAVSIAALMRPYFGGYITSPFDKQGHK